jgi:chromosome segregation ATPase
MADIGLLTILQNNPSVYVVAFVFLCLLLSAKPTLELIDWFKKRKQLKADAESTTARTSLDAFITVENNKQEVINTLMEDMKNMKSSFEAQKIEYRSEIAALKDEITLLRREIRNLQKTVNEKINDNFRLESTIRLKEHEIAMLRSWAKTAVARVAGTKIALDPVPDPIEERRVDVSGVEAVRPLNS